MFFFGVLLALGAEVGAFVAVGEQIGFLWAFGMLFLASALGPFVVRRVGLGVLSNTRARLARGEVPTRELLDGLVVLLGGLLICVPGFIGDALGLALMIDPVRRFVIRFSGQRLSRRVQRMGTGRWQVINVRARPPSEDSPGPSGPPSPPLGPGPPDRDS